MKKALKKMHEWWLKPNPLFSRQNVLRGTVVVLTILTFPEVVGTDWLNVAFWVSLDGLIISLLGLFFDDLAEWNERDYQDFMKKE